MELKARFLEELQELASAEELLIACLPELITAAANPQLSSVFERHLRQTELQSGRIKRVFASLGLRQTLRPCRPMGALIGEASNASVHGWRGSVRDFVLVDVARRIEQFEIAAYTSVVALAEALEYFEAVNLLTQNLVEEQTTTQQLTAIHDEMVARAQETRSGA